MDLTWRDVKTTTKRRGAQALDADNLTSSMVDGSDRDYKFVNGRQRSKRRSQMQRPERSYQSVLRVESAPCNQEEEPADSPLPDFDTTINHAINFEASLAGTGIVEESWTPSSTSKEGCSLFLDNISDSPLLSPSHIMATDAEVTSGDFVDTMPEDAEDDIEVLLRNDIPPWTNGYSMEGLQMDLDTQNTVLSDQQMIMQSYPLSPGILFRDLGHKFGPVLEQCQYR